MTKRNELYKCQKCGHIIEVMNGGSHPVCCGDNMTLITDNTVEASREKHIPVIEKFDGGYKVIVGEVEHPMIETHFIEWIELFVGSTKFTKFLKAGDKPEATFKTDCNSTEVFARAYCNLHGNWKKDL